MSLNVQKSFREDGSGVGTLYLVATPIGNLEDMTFRAIRTLKEVSMIAAEDTRQTRKLLTHFEVATRLVSYHEHNKQASGPELVRLLLEGQSIALVSDAGLPAISDPGYDLVRMAVLAERAGGAHPRRECGPVGADCIRLADRAFRLRRVSPPGEKGSDEGA